MFEIGTLHVISLLIAIISLIAAIRLMKNQKKRYEKFKKVKVGDKVKFYAYCYDDDCILNGTVTEVRDQVLEIEVDTKDMICKTCLKGLQKINKHYKDVII